MSGERPEDRQWMAVAIELAQRCPPSERAFSVGAILVDVSETRLADGYSREIDPLAHAEEAALAKLASRHPGGLDLAGATMYSTLEPCSRRASRPRSCAELIIEAGIGRVVLAWREPSLFVADAQGSELLEAAGVGVVELPELAEAARAMNAHLLG